jgi:hypothetical protein
MIGVLPVWRVSRQRRQCNFGRGANEMSAALAALMLSS